MKNIRRTVIASLIAAPVVLISNAANSQVPFPTKAITLIVPFAPGGSTDIIGRIIAEGLTKQLGQAVVVDNKAGAGGSLGARAIATAQPDGYTLGLATVSTHVINPIVQPQISKIDPIKDFTLISQIASIPNVVSINSQVPAKNLAEFISYARANPGKLNYGTPGSGSLGHMMGETFKSEAKVFLTHIPYRGAAPALNDTISGQVQVLFDNLPSSLPHIKSGKLLALAVAADQPLAALPGVPTFAQAGLKAVNDAAWVGLVGPHGLPADVEKRLHTALLKVLNSPEAKAKFDTLLAQTVGGTEAEFKKVIEAHAARTRATIKSAALKFE